MSWSFQRRVRYYETDRMGVVHHANYLRLIEDARMDWIDDNIMRYSDMERMGIIIPAVSAAGNFKSYLHFDELFTITVRLVKFTGVRMEFEYEVHSEDTGELCYDGKTVHYFAADGDYKPFSVKKKYPEIYEAFRKMLEPSEKGLLNKVRKKSE